MDETLDSDKPFQLWTHFQDESPGIFEGFETEEVAIARGCEYSLKPIIYGTVSLVDKDGFILGYFENGKFNREVVGCLHKDTLLFDPQTQKNNHPFKLPQSYRPNPELFQKMCEAEDKIQGGLTAGGYLESRPSWDEYFLKLAIDVSLRSEDVFIKHGCILVNNKTHHIIGTGYNAMFRGADKSKIDIYNRDLRRPYYIHAEENSIMNCTVNPLDLIKGARAYITGRSCNVCLQRLINFGITEIIELDRQGSITESPQEEEMRQTILSMVPNGSVTIRKFDPTHLR